MMTAEQYFALSFWQRFLYRRFPPRALPAAAQGGLYITGSLVTRLGWGDRIRVLFSGHLANVIRIEVNVPVEPARMDVATWVLPPGTVEQHPAEAPS